MVPIPYEMINDVPVVYRMVNLDGLDLSTINGSYIPGLYNKVTSAMYEDKIEVFYNWYFAGFIVPPSFVHVDDSVSGQYTINDAIVIQSNDRVSVVGNIPIINPLAVTENGTYDVEQGVTGFAPVVVNVQPILEQLTALSNGTYTPSEGVYGFSSVTVNVAKVIQSLSITQNGTYTAGEGIDGYSPVVVNVPIPTPVTEQLSVTANGVYTPGQGVDGFSQVTVNVPISQYIYLHPVHQGLSYGYNAYGGFQTSTDDNSYLCFYEVPAGKYVLFLPETYGNRYRANVFYNKTYSDFEPYVNNPASLGVVISTNRNINSDSEQDIRYYITMESPGVIAVTTSNNRNPIESVLLKKNS